MRIIWLRLGICLAFFFAVPFLFNLTKRIIEIIGRLNAIDASTAHYFIRTQLYKVLR